MSSPMAAEHKTDAVQIRTGRVCPSCREDRIVDFPCLCERLEGHFERRNDDPVTAPSRWIDKAEWGA